MMLVSIFPMDDLPKPKPGRWVILGAKWRSGLHSIGIVAVASGRDKERWNARKVEMADMFADMVQSVAGQNTLSYKSLTA